MEFTTHTKEVITGSKLEDAIQAVKRDMIAIAHAIKKEDAYASHVTEEQKEQNLIKSITYADNIHNKLHNLSIWQKVNYKLTGECVGLLN